MKLNKSIVVAIVSSMALPLVAQNATFSLDDCRTKALAHNKTLGVARLQLEKSEYDVKAFKANFLPNFSLVAMDMYSPGSTTMTVKGGNLPIYNYNAETGTYVPSVIVDPQGQVVGLSQYAYFPDMNMKLQMHNLFMGGITMTEPLYMGGKITAAYKMAKAGREMATSNIRLTESEVIVRTDEAYVMAIRAKQLGNVARSYRDLLVELKKNVDAAIKQGMKTNNDAMKVQVKLNEAELSIKKAENGYRLAQMNLASIVGLPLTQKIDVDDSVIESQQQVVAASADAMELSSRPEMGILANKVEIARQNIKLAMSEFLPNVILTAGYEYLNGMKFNNERIFNTGTPTVSVAVKVPLFHFGEGVNKVRSAKAAHRIADMERQELVEKMTLELTQAANLVEESALEVSMSLLSREQATDNLRISRHQYNLGLEPLSDLLEAQAIWQQACAAYIESACQSLLATSKYMKANGTLR